MTTHATWIDHFPDNFTYSSAMLVTKGMAPYGAVALEEADNRQVGIDYVAAWLTENL